ncbi:MAG TPA: hypothetical protein VHL34_24685 [Rhizomicrobium sp.]|nr:hypothetical protein [Rhizomicrobium sp.]
MVGRRAVVAKYGGRPWEEVKRAAEAGEDGLRLVREGALRLTAEQFESGLRGYFNYNVQLNEFALREIRLLGQQVAGLFLQNWDKNTPVKAVA